MTVQEYIQTVDTKPFHFRDRVCADINIKRFAYNVSHKARKEELMKINEILNDEMLDNYERIDQIVDYIADVLS